MAQVALTIFDFDSKKGVEVRRGLQTFAMPSIHSTIVVFDSYSG